MKNPYNFAMKTSGLTDKNMADKRFRKTEYAIFFAYYKLKSYPSAKKIAKTARISRSTLYRHHKKVQAISVDYEKYLLHDYAKTINKLIEKNAEIRVIYLRTLVFIMAHRRVFRALFKEDRKEVVKSMVGLLKARIIVKEWHLSGNLDKMYNIYTNEVLAVIEFWSQQNFTDKVLERTLNDVLYLTKVSRKKLLPLK
ncbi:hypothetical protein J5491_02535 [Candidatus Saccharibacteria bacterium]|nr:hypothetical protein [Candidatus Saccharibacteria bacterium]